MFFLMNKKNEVIRTSENRMALRRAKRKMPKADSLRIIEGDNGLFIAMPSRKTPVGEYKDIAHPINQEVRTMFEKAILDAYENAEDEEPSEDNE